MVLGSGPASLFATHALYTSGWDFEIFSKHGKSHMYGAQYLHKPIPELSETDPVNITYRLEGTAEQYQRKVYGTTTVPSVSVQDLTPAHAAWDIREAYDNAWNLYGGKIESADLSFSVLIGARTEIMETYDLVVSAVPLKALCVDPQQHRFLSKEIWAYGDAPDRGQLLSNVFSMPPDNTVLCNGMHDVGWYRLSNIFGHATVEYPYTRKPPLSDAAEVVKPIRNFCSCYQNSRLGLPFLPVGRYGRWEKGILSHQAYDDVLEVIKGI